MKRRAFLSTATGTLAASTVFPSFAIGKPGPSANSKLNVAFIGSGGWIARQPYEQGCSEENLVAFCDVDRNHSAENMKNWQTTQPFFDDYRVMLDKMHKDIDAIVISTPDHTHFPATLAAMERGIHVYTQKPLTHNIWQARTLVKAKDRYKVVTQMGNQGHAGDGIRKSVEAYRAGLIGEVGEVFCPQRRPGDGRPAFRQSGRRCRRHRRRFPRVSHGTCGSDLRRNASSIRTTCPTNGGPFTTSAPACWATGAATPSTRPSGRSISIRPMSWNAWSAEDSLDGMIPAGSRIKYHFPANAKRGPVVLNWFDGPQDWTKVGRIDKFGADHAAHLGRACWMVGTKGMIGCGTHAGMPLILPNDLRKEWQANPPAETIPRVAGGPFREWLSAIKQTGPEPGSNFNYSAKLTEIILLGVLAQRFNTRIEWDAKAGRITNHPELNVFVKEPAREGWEYGEDLWKEG